MTYTPGYGDRATWPAWTVAPEDMDECDYRDESDADEPWPESVKQCPKCFKLSQPETSLAFDMAVCECPHCSTLWFDDL